MSWLRDEWSKIAVWFSGRPTVSSLLRVSAENIQGRRANLLFIHGLGGDKRNTWQDGNDGSSFWPAWLAEDIPDIAVYSIGYDASPSQWLGRTMPLVDRATQLLDLLRTKDIH